MPGAPTYPDTSPLWATSLVITVFRSKTPERRPKRHAMPPAPAVSTKSSSHRPTLRRRSTGRPVSRPRHESPAASHSDRVVTLHLRHLGRQEQSPEQLLRKLRWFKLANHNGHHSHQFPQALTAVELRAQVGMHQYSPLGTFFLTRSCTQRYRAPTCLQS